MMRKIIKAFGRFQVGEHHDYPRGTWNKMELDARKADPKFKLADHAEEVENPALQNMLRGPLRQKPRLGSPASAARAAAAATRH